MSSFSDAACLFFYLSHLPVYPHPNHHHRSAQFSGLCRVISWSIRCYCCTQQWHCRVVLCFALIFVVVVSAKKPELSWCSGKMHVGIHNNLAGLICKWFTCCHLRSMSVGAPPPPPSPTPRSKLLLLPPPSFPHFCCCCLLSPSITPLSLKK